MGKKFFILSVVRHRNRLPTGYPVDAPPWKCSRPGWMGLWATWSSGRCPCPQQGVGTRWSLRFLPTQTILWFYENPADCINVVLMFFTLYHLLRSSHSNYQFCMLVRSVSAQLTFTVNQYFSFLHVNQYMLTRFTNGTQRKHMIQIKMRIKHCQYF